MARPRTTRKPPPRVGQVGISFDPNEKARALKSLNQATTAKERAEAMSDLIAVQTGGAPRASKGGKKAGKKAGKKVAKAMKPKSLKESGIKGAGGAALKMKRVKALESGLKGGFMGMKLDFLKDGPPSLGGYDPDAILGARGMKGSGMDVGARGMKGSGMDVGSMREAVLREPSMDYDTPIGPEATPEQLRKMREMQAKAAKKMREQEKKLREKARKAAKSEKEKAQRDAMKATLALAKAAKGKDRKDLTAEERRALSVAARVSAAAKAERERKATFKRAKSRALMLSGGAGLKPAKFGNSCSRTPPPASKCRTKGEIRLLATALKLDACKPGVLPTQFGRRAGEYIELMKYQKPPRQFMPAAYVDSIMPRKEQVLEVRMRDGVPVISKTTGKPIPKKVVQVPSFGGLLRLARRLPPGGVRKMLLPEE